MGIFDYKFRRAKSDQSPFLFHFTKGTENNAKTVLYSILEQQKLISSQKQRDSDNYICFTASPITSLKTFFETKVIRTDLPMYQPFGIGFDRDILIESFGARNVIYCDEEEMEQIPKELKWRAQKIKINSYDYEYLREWRIKGSFFDFKDFPKDKIIIIAPHSTDLYDLIVGHDFEYNPIVDSYTGDLIPEFEEIFPRNYKGLSLDRINTSFTDDYQVLGETHSQNLGEDMFSLVLRGIDNICE